MANNENTRAPAGGSEEREQMTDEWLRDQWERAVAVASMGYGDDADGIKALLRGFANRVLQSFGDREGMRDALNIGFTRTQAVRAALSGGSPEPGSEGEEEGGKA